MVRRRKGKEHGKKLSKERRMKKKRRKQNQERPEKSGQKSLWERELQRR